MKTSYVLAWAFAVSREPARNLAGCRSQTEFRRWPNRHGGGVVKRINGLCILIAITAIGATSARAELDYATLPPYCKWRLQGAPGQYEVGQRQFGIGNWDHMHHYCNALDWMNKYRRARS